MARSAAEEAIDPAMRLGSLYQADYSLMTVVPTDELSLPGKVAKVTRQKQNAADDYLNAIRARMRRNSQKTSAQSCRDR